MKWLVAALLAVALLAFSGISTVAQGQEACAATPSTLMQDAAKQKLKAVHVSGDAAKRIAKALQAPVEPSDLVAFAAGDGSVYIALFIEGCFRLAGRFEAQAVKEHFPTLVE